jgi:hypothetical protein
MRMNRILAIAAVLTLGAHHLEAQVVSDSIVNRRVRVHMARQDRSVEGQAPRQALRGTLIRSTADSITVLFHPDAAPVSIDHNGIYRIDVSRGISARRTALRHAAGGALMWAATGTLVESELGGGELENALIWAAGGLVTGAILGTIFPEESWTRVFRR